MPLAYLQHLHNLAAVDRSIRRGELLKADDLAATLGVVPRGIYRYLATLKSEFAAPIVFAPGVGYTYRRPWDFPAAVAQWIKRQAK